MSLLDTFLVRPLTVLRDGLNDVLGIIAYLRGTENLEQYVLDLEEDSVPHPMQPEEPELLVVHSIKDYCERFPGHIYTRAIHMAFINCAQGVWVTKEGTLVAIWHPEDSQ